MDFVKKRRTVEQLDQNSELTNAPEQVDQADPDFENDIYRLITLFQQVILDYHHNINVLPTLNAINTDLALFLDTYRICD